MSTQPSSAETYAAEAINETAAWPRDTTPVTWKPGTSPARIGRWLILKDNKRYGWYHQPPALHYKELPEVAEWAAPSGSGLDPRWRRLPLGSERSVPCASVFDRNGSYLSIAGSAALPCGTPEWVDGARFVKEPGKSAQAGLWHVSVNYGLSLWNGTLLPAVCPEGDDVWLWSATVRCAQECGYSIGPAAEHPGAILWPEQHKALGVWAPHLWAARRLLETDDGTRFPDASARSDALSLVKLVYSMTIGMFGMVPRANEPTQEEIDAGLGDEPETLPRWRRPEWQRTIKADAAARMFYYARRAVERGQPPLWMQADSFGFPAIGSPQEIADAAGLNTTPGQCGAMRHDCDVPMSELLDAQGRDITVPGRTHRLKLPGVREGRVRA